MMSNNSRILWTALSGYEISIDPTLTRRLSGFEILNNATLIFQKWLVSRIFGNICHDLKSPEEY